MTAPLPKYQTITKRVIAGFIDGLVFYPFSFIIEYLSKDEYGNFDEFNNAVIWWTFLQTLLWAIYVVVGHGKFGQTLGKKAMGIKVLDLDEIHTIRYKRACYRESVWIITQIVGFIYFLIRYRSSNSDIIRNPSYTLDEYLSFTIILWTVIEIVTTLSNSKRRAVHDYIGKSVVIDMSELKKESILVQS